MPAKPVNRQQPKREQNALAQVGNAEYVGQLLKHGTTSVAADCQTARATTDNWLLATDNFHFAAGLLDLLLGRLGKLVRTHRDSTFQFTLSQYLDQCVPG